MGTKFFSAYRLSGVNWATYTIEIRFWRITLRYIFEIRK